MPFRFGDIELDVDAFELRRAGVPVHVEPQVFEVVSYLLANRDRMVPKEELLEQVWETRFVSESALTSRIKAARRALGDDGREQRVIRTVHGRGYRFVADVEEVVVDPASGPLAARGAAGASREVRAPSRRRGSGGRVLEREAALDVLSTAVAEAATGAGRIVLVSGEAGIGKTSLVREFLRGHHDLRVLSGSCDDLVTARPLGPFRDIAPGDAPQLAAALGHPGGGDVQRALLAELERAPSPAVLVVEDLHWADEATVDVLTYLVRRIADVPALVVLTYRDGEVAGAHPLVPLLGLVPSELSERVRLEPLSPAAVAELVGADRAGAVVATTGGVPFFVTELMAMGSAADPGELPSSVAHAVRARVARLPDATARLLDLLAVEPTRTQVGVLDALRPSWADDVEPAERAAMVTVNDETVAFRHELARRAVLEVIPSARRRALHREVAGALVALGADPARVVHHAEAGGDLPLLVEQALSAAMRASSVNAHREAWSQYRRVVARLDLLPREEHAEVLEGASHEAYMAGDAAAALELGQRALDELRAGGDDIATGRVHRWLSRVHWYQGRRLQAEVQAQLAVKVLEPLPPSIELAWAYSNLSQLAMLSWRYADSLRWAERSIALAQQLDADDVLVHALVNVGSVRAMEDPDDEGPIRDAIALAQARGDHHEATRAMIAYAYNMMDLDLPGPAETAARDVLQYADDHEVEALRPYVIAMLGRITAMRGRWEEAEDLLRPIVATGAAVPLIAALTSLAWIQVRRGDADAARTLDRAWPLVEATGEPQRIVPLAVVEAERAWLRGALDPSVRHLRDGYDLARRGRRHGRLARWLQEAGGLDHIPEDVPEPWRAELEGRWADAVAAWRLRGMPYEEALALAHLDEAGRRRAVEIAGDLGAAPLLRRLRAASMREPATRQRHGGKRP